MTPAFDDIMQSRSKEDLENYARGLGIELDRRRSFDNMLAQLREAQAQDAASAPEAPAPARMIEVELLRKYVPHGFADEAGVWRPQRAEIKESMPAGSVVALPAEEAQRALKLGIAQITARSFN